MTATDAEEVLQRAESGDGWLYTPEIERVFF